MMRGTWVYRDGKLVPKHEAEPVVHRGPQSEMAAPMYIADGIPDLIGPGGRYYSSKSELRREYKARGLVELGNDAPTTTIDNRQPVTKAEVGEAYRKVRDGYRPAPLEHGLIPIADE